MLDLDSFHEVLTSIGRHKLRTALTAIGVFFGVVTFAAMAAFGPALRGGVNKQMAGFANNAVFVFAQRTSEPYAGLPANRAIQLDNSDIDALRRLDGVDAVAPRHMLGGFRAGNVVTHGTKAGSFQVAGDYPDFQVINQALMRAGRFVNATDIAERRKVAVIGDAIAGELYGPGEDPIGSAIEINGIHFVVVGVFGSRAPGERGDMLVRTVHIPFTTFQQAFHTGDKVAWFALTMKPGVDPKDFERRVHQALGQRHQVSPTDTTAFRGWNLGEQYAKTQSLFTAIGVVLTVAGLFSLLAGAIGVSNIMLISVRERTKEIGVRKALGASPVKVVGMVVSEAVVLTVLAGFVGMVVAVLGIEAAAWKIAGMGPDFPLAPPHVSFGFALAATATLVVVGAFAGLIPAVRAAAISPVEALRDE